MNHCRALLRYMLWADRAQLGALASVEPEHLLQDTGTSHGSLLGTMAHILGGERMWLSRFVGNPLDHVPGLDDYPDLPRLLSGFEELWPELEFFMASLNQTQIEGEITWTSTEGRTFTAPLWQPLLHLVNHSTYHRGQVTTMLRQMGYEPIPTDLIYFLLDR